MTEPESTARGVRWERYADEGTCEYCGHNGAVRPDPFGQQAACFGCWEAISYGDES